MPLSIQEMEALFRLVCLTRDNEIHCDQCLLLLAEFAEQVRTVQPLAEGLHIVRQHLAICPECQEEYQVLRRVLSECPSEGSSRERLWN